MQKLFFYFLTFLVVFGIKVLKAEDFNDNSQMISEFEYGQMLYNNPRGVSCMPCHGVKGGGKEIVSFVEDNIKKTLVAPDIRDKSFEDYKKAVKTGPSIMPKYFLTQEELKAIFSYIQRAKMEDNLKELQDQGEDLNESNFDDNLSFDSNLSQDSEFNQTVNNSSLE